MDDRILFKIQISACGNQMMTYNEDRSLTWESGADIDIISHFFPDLEFPDPILDSDGNISGWDIPEAKTYDDLIKRKAYVWGHMDGTIIVFDELYDGDYDLIGW